MFISTRKHLMISTTFCSDTLPPSIGDGSNRCSDSEMVSSPDKSRNSCRKSIFAVDRVTLNDTKCLLSNDEDFCLKISYIGYLTAYAFLKPSTKCAGEPSSGLFDPVHHPHNPPVYWRSIGLVSA